MTRINIPLPDDLHKQAKIASLMSDLSLKDFINIAINEKVARDRQITSQTKKGIKK